MSEDRDGIARSFIEHIRTIHFALVVASAALWIALLASFEPRTTRKALEDCGRIQNLSSQLEWESWWTAYATDQWTLRESSPFSNSVRYASFDLPAYRRYWKIQFPSTVWSVQGVRQGAGNEPSISWDGTRISIEPPPRTLNAFRQFWDRGREPHVVVKPRRPDSITVFAEPFDDDQKPFSADLPLLREANVVSTASDPSVVENDFRNATELQPVTTYSLKLMNSAADASRRVDYALEVPGGMPTDFPLRTRNMRIVAHAVMDEFPSRTPVAWLCERYQPGWTPQQFDKAFAELLSVAPTEARDLPLVELADRIRASIRLTKGDVDIAGLRLPSETLTWFAPLIIISLQLYLLLHVRVLFELSSRAVPIPLVAWVALFANAAAHGVFIVSAAALPAAVLIFATVQAVLLQLSGVNIVFQVAGATTAIAQGFALITSMRTIWANEAKQRAR